MPYAAKIATRYLRGDAGQTLLLVGGVAVGVIVFVFMSSLIGGLARTLTDAVVGNIAHVMIEPLDRVPGSVLDSRAGSLLVAAQKANDRREAIGAWTAAVDVVSAMTDVAAVSPEITGSAVLTRGQATRSVQLTGVEPDRLSVIARVDARMVAGKASVGELDAILVGQKLADQLGIGPGQTVAVRSERGRLRSFTVAGTFKLGSDAFDEGTAFVNIRAARPLFDLPQAVTRIAVKLQDLKAARDVARRIAAATGLKATSWSEKDPTLDEVLASQAGTGGIVKGFAMLAVMIGVASALRLSTYRRSAEIGIMRAMGASQRLVLTIFLFQGAAIGAMGSLAGAGLGFGFVELLLVLSPPGSPGGLPNDPAQGGYVTAFVLTTFGATLAAVLPARAAARTDPLSVLGG